MSRIIMMAGVVAFVLIGCAAEPPAITFAGIEQELNAANANMRSGEYLNARRRYQRLVSIAPGYPDFRLGLARAHAALGANDAAADELAILIASGFDSMIAKDPALNGMMTRPALAALRAKDRAATMPAAREAFVLPDRDFIPENLVYDTVSRRFLIGSTYQRRIITRAEDGKFAEFVPRGDHGLLKVLGMKADIARNRLLVCTAADDKRMVNFREADLGHSAVFIYELTTGVFVRSA